jgi:hypothetical protein
LKLVVAMPRVSPAQWNRESSPTGGWRDSHADRRRSALSGRRADLFVDCHILRPLTELQVVVVQTRRVRTSTGEAARRGRQFLVRGGVVGDFGDGSRGLLRLPLPSVRRYRRKPPVWRIDHERCLQRDVLPAFHPEFVVRAGIIGDPSSGPIVIPGSLKLLLGKFCSLLGACKTLFVTKLWRSFEGGIVEELQTPDRSGRPPGVRGTAEGACFCPSPVNVRVDLGAVVAVWASIAWANMVTVTAMPTPAEKFPNTLIDVCSPRVTG